MTNRLLHILYIGVFLFLTASCSKDEALPRNAEDGKVQVTFTLAVDGAMARSRATWGESYDSWLGGTYDNRIEPNKLQVMICDTDCTPLAKVERLLHYQTSDNTYTFTGVVSSINRTADNRYKIMVFANCPDVDATTDLTALKYDLLGATTSIPMWGVHTITTPFEAGSNTDAGTIHLLRAMARIEVTLDESIADEFTLAEVAHLTPYNRYGYCLPEGYGNVGETEDLDTEACFNPLLGEGTKELIFQQIGNDNHFITYSSEYDNVDKGGNGMSMEVMITRKSDGSKVALQNNKIVIRDYEHDQTLNIIRNHKYTFNIIKVQDGGKLELTCAVQPWNVQEEVLEYTNHVTFKDEGKLRWTAGTYQEITGKGEVILRKDATPATCTFKLDSPLGGVWYASLEPLKGNASDAFKFVDAAGNELQPEDVKGNVGETATLYVTVTDPTADVVSEARLVIAVHMADGRTIRVKKLAFDVNVDEYIIVQSN